MGADELAEQEWIDLGHGVRMQWRGWADHDHAGLFYEHRRPDTGAACHGAVMFDLPGVRENFSASRLWQVESMEPLTVSPSLLCRVCGHHGFIRNGRWEPA